MAPSDRVYLTRSPAFATLRINAVFDAAKQAVSMVDATATFQYCSGPPGESTMPLPACLNPDSAQPINLHPAAAVAAAVRILAQTQLMLRSKVRSPFTAGCSTVVAGQSVKQQRWLLLLLLYAKQGQGVGVPV